MPDNPFAFWELVGMQIDRLGGTHFALACFDSFPFRSWFCGLVGIIWEGSANTLTVSCFLSEEMWIENLNR
jgi:hypothetical protein